MKRGILAALVAAACLVMVSTSAFATLTCTKADPCVVRIGTVAPDHTPWATIAEKFEHRVERDSGGRLNVIPRLGSTSGENSLVRQCHDGSIEGIGVSTGAMASAVPAMSVFEIPFLFESSADADRIIDNYLMDPVKKLLEKHGFKLFIFTENGYMDFATTTGKAIHSPADMKGIQWRARESWIHQAMYRALGVNYTTLPVAQVQTALSTGKIQGYDETPLFAQAAGWTSSIKTWTISHHIYQPAVIVFNLEWYNSLPADLQKIIMTNRMEATRSGRKMIRRVNPLLIQNLKRKGIKVVKMTDAEKAVFEKATMGIRKEFSERIPAGGKLLDLIVKHL